MIELDLPGMTCGHCVASVTRAVKAVDPEATVAGDLTSRRVAVSSGHAEASVRVRALDRAGDEAAVV